MDYLLKASLLFAYVATSCFGLYHLKKASEILTIEFIAGFFFYGVGFLMWLYILRRMPLAIAFPLAAGGLIVGTQLVGHFLLDEPLQVLHLVGIGLILVALPLIFVNA